jgi:hypothetical protein
VDHIETFRQHADDCRSMARIASDAESRATWNEMAERWLRCARNAQGNAHAPEAEDGREPRKTNRRRMPRVVAIQKKRREASH